MPTILRKKKPIRYEPPQSLRHKFRLLRKPFVGLHRPANDFGDFSLGKLDLKSDMV